MVGIPGEISGFDMSMSISMTWGCVIGKHDDCKSKLCTCYCHKGERMRENFNA